MYERPNEQPSSVHFMRLRGILAAATMLLALDVSNADAAPDPAQSYCAPPTAAAMQAVTELFSQAPSAHESGAPDTSYAAEQAALLGVTLPHVDWQQLDSMELAAETENTRPPFAAYQALAQGVLSQEGIQFHIGTVPDMGVSAKTPTAEELETNRNAEYQLAEVARTFGSIPMSLIKKVGIHEIAITAHAEGIIGLALFDPNILIIDIDGTSMNDGTIRHELFHEIDAAECGGSERMGDDPTYASLNRNLSYTNGPEPSDAYLRAHHPLSSDYTESVDLLTRAAYVQQNGAMAVLRWCNAYYDVSAKLAGAQVTTPYAYTAVKEDKPDLGKYLLVPGDYSLVLDPRSPVIREKAIVLLARMYQLDPEAVRYFLALSMPQTQIPFACP